MESHNSILNNVSNLAVWGSLASSFVLAAFMFVQAALSEKRRLQFLLFGALSAAVVATDLLRPALTSLEYESFRIVIWAFMPASLLWLFGIAAYRCLLLGIIVLAAGKLVWFSGYPELSSSVVIPVAFYCAALAHGWLYFRDRGYASCILATFSAILGLMCSLYYPIVSSGDSWTIGLGYFHYALISVFSVIFGWVHLPRELRGLAPVKLSLRHGVSFFALMLLSEALLQGVLLLGTRVQLWYLALSLFQAAAVSLLYFYKRHQLVIYTDNISQLLEERTRSLKAAQEELAKQYDIQAIRLEQQARELEEKASVIERQRRLELAAQTAGQAAHDIQNLISPILAWVQDLKRNVENPDYISTRVTDLEQQIRNLLDLNSQMLCLARRGRIERTLLNTRELAEESVRLFPHADITVEIDTSAWLLGSWGQLLRAMSNLIANALEAPADAMNSVVVRAGERRFDEVTRCHLGFLQPGRYAYLEVQDSGTGIPSQIVEQIFEPFFSSKTSGHRSGSGLGLSIVTAVVDDLGGVLDLVTGSDGTTFTMYFSIASAPAAAPTEKVCRNETVLVIDDDSVVLKECEDLLEKAGFTAFLASSGSEGLKFLQSCSVDVVILDFSMPGLNGQETSFAILNVKPGTPIIVHSSYLTDNDRSKLLELGATAILSKPCSPSQLLAAVEHALAATQKTAFMH